MTVDLPPTHPIQVLSDAVHEVVVRDTPPGLDLGRYPTPTVAASPVPIGAFAPSVTPAAAFDSRSNRVTVLQASSATLVRAGELLGGRWTPRQQAWVGLVIHEHLHGLSAGRAARYGTNADRGVEEAAVDAVATDLTPQVVDALAGASRVDRTGEVSLYPECVARVRVASTVATRARSWRATAAAGWRMRLVMAMPRERVAMLAATGTAPEGVCPL